MFRLSSVFAFVVASSIIVTPALCASFNNRAHPKGLERLRKRQEPSCATTQTAERASSIVADISGLPNTISSIKSEFQQVSEQLAAIAASGVADGTSIGSVWNLNLQDLEGILDSAASAAAGFVSDLDNFIAITIAQTDELLSNGDFTEATSLLQEFEDAAQNFASDAQQVINNFQSAQANLNILATGVQTLGSEFNSETTLFSVSQNIVSQLNSPMDIWSAVNSDNGEGIAVITGILDLLQDAPGDVPLIFLGTVNNAVCFYQVMISTLLSFRTAAMDL